MTVNNCAAIARAIMTNKHYCWRCFYSQYVRVFAEAMREPWAWPLAALFVFLFSIVLDLVK